MHNYLNLLRNQASSDSGIMIAVGWLITEMIGINNAVFAIVAVIFAFAAATKADKTVLGVVFFIIIIALGCAVKFGLLS